MGNYELSDKQIEQILRGQMNKAVDNAFFKLSQHKQSKILIQASLKAELTRILKGELVYEI